MSVLNRDQDIVNEGRQQPLQGVEASLRDQIPAKLADKLDELEIGTKVSQIWYAGNANRAAWLERQHEYLADWDEFLESTAEGPFPGSSNLHIPVPLIVAKTLHARFLQALLGIDPPFTVKPRTEASVDRAELVQDLMAYTLKDWMNYYQGADAVIDSWLWDWVTTGCGIMKARWDCMYERFIDVRPVQRPGPVLTRVDEQGNTITIPTLKTVEEEQEITQKTFEGPCADFVHNEDFLIIGGEGDVERADSVHHSQYLTASELLTLVDRKVFREEEVLDVIKGGPDHQLSSDYSGIKIQRAQNAGQAQLNSQSNLDRYQIIESYLRVDVDGSGINSNVVTWVHAKSRKLLRATYLRRINKAGTRPFFKIDFHRRTGQDYGVGIIEMLHPISKELDAMHNLRVDYGMISTMPFGFYRPTTSLDPKTIPLRPGTLIPLDNPTQDVYFPNLGNRSSFGMQEEQSLNALVERLTTISDINLGVMSGTQGATRTATGTQALMGESNSNLDVYIRRLNRGWKQFLQYTFGMLQQRLPPGLEFRVTGEAGSDYFRQVRDQQWISGAYDFEVSPNSANSNKSIQQQTAQQVYQATASPLDIQLGIVSPLERYEAVKLYYKSLGIKDYGKFARKPIGIERLLSPEEEANRVLRGVDVPVTPEMDHEGFIAYFQEIYDTDELLGQFSQEQATALARQAQQHKQMQAALQQMQAQQANVAQMRLNSQAGPGANPMYNNGSGAPQQTNPYTQFNGAVISQPQQGKQSSQF